MMDRKKILLTGATGFIGSYFLRHYANQHEINTFSFLHDNFRSLDLHNMDIVIHLSALVHQMNGSSKEEYDRVNVKQTMQLAHNAKKAGIKQFIFMSTVKVYGEENSIVYDELSVCEPQDEYGKSKLKAEGELLKLEDENFKVSIVRTPIVYGEDVKANIKRLKQMIQYISILPFRNIQNKRSMVYLGNLCHLINELILRNKSGIFLASDDRALSTEELTKLIASSLKKKIYVIKLPLFEMILKYFKPDYYKRLYGNLEVNNDRTKKVLDLKNPYSIEKGIELMVKGEV